VKVPALQNVKFAELVPSPMKAVPSVPSVMLVKRVRELMVRVKRVKLVSTATVEWLTQQRVFYAQVVLTKVMKAKLAAFLARQVNFKIMPVQPSVNFVQYRPTLVAKPETGRALIVPPVGHQEKAAPSVNLARLELSATSKVQPVKVVTSDSIVKVKRKMPMVLLRKKVQILQSVLIVLPDGRPKQAAQNVSLARQGVSVTRKAKHVKVVTSDSIVKVKRKMSMVL